MTLLPGHGAQIFQLPSRIAYLQSPAISLSEVTVHTFLAQNLGPAHPKRCIVLGACGVKGLSSNVRQIDSITVGGIAATLLTRASAAGGDFTACSALFALPFPTGIMADVVVTFNLTARDCRLSMWYLQHPKANITPHNVQAAVSIAGTVLALPALNQKNCMITYATGDAVVASLTPPIEAQDFGFGISSAGKHKNRTGSVAVVPVMTTSAGVYKTILGASW